MTLNIAIIIPVYNTFSHTKKCLQEIFSDLESRNLQSFYHVIIVDDGSTDGTSQWISENHPETVILKGDGNLWWSGGINLGIKHAIQNLKSDYVLWWNNDISSEPAYFHNLFELLKDKTIEIGGSKIYYANSNRVWSMGGYFDTVSGRKHMIGMNEPDQDQFNDITEADWLPGMGTFIRTDVFQRIGLVDNVSFPQYHGDSDFTYRAKLAGYRIFVYPHLKIWNDKSNSGILHDNSLKQLIKTLADTKSQYHFYKDIAFYRRYATSVFAYRTLAYKYCYYLGGFVKWKILNSIGLSKKQSV